MLNYEILTGRGGGRGYLMRSTWHFLQKCRGGLASNFTEILFMKRCVKRVAFQGAHQRNICIEH